VAVIKVKTRATEEVEEEEEEEEEEWDTLSFLPRSLLRRRLTNRS
jgi:hypothetical protein